MDDFLQVHKIIKGEEFEPKFESSLSEISIPTNTTSM